MTLADDFQIAERPVILVEMDFDGGSINVWSRPFSGDYAGRSYQPIAGITGAFSVRQSLDRPSLATAAQITGAAGEIQAAALTEPFQGRPARIRLGNLDAAGAISNTEILLSGTIEDIPLIDDATGSTAAVKMQSIFSRIGRARDLRYAKADQKTVDANDSFFDFVSTADVETPRFGA